MNRFDLSKRLVARLQNEEAVIGGIGHTNFDLWSAGHRPQNFYMLGSMGLAVPIALGVALAQPQRKVFALEGDGSILMQLGCLATVATLAAEEPDHPGDGQRRLPDHRRPADAGGRRRGLRGDRARLRPGEFGLGEGRGGFRAAGGGEPGGRGAAADRPEAGRRQAADADRARPGADPGPVHARDGGEEEPSCRGRGAGGALRRRPRYTTSTFAARAIRPTSSAPPA